MASVYNSSHTGAQIDTGVDAAAKAAIVNLIYPVGAIYISYNSTSPATLFGGTWTQIQGRFLLSSSSSYSAGSTGGAASINISHSHTTKAGTTGGTAITVAQMPSHCHSINPNALSWPENASAAEHIANNWGTSSWPKVSGIGNTAYTGSGEAHTHSQVAVGTDAKLSSSQSIMPPYLVVYMWRRTA